jgi:SMC interacting uncharacterized protein involved in chromosome segregation
MDKKELQETAEQIINKAYEMTKKTAKAISEKAGEAAHVTKLMVEKITVEHKISQKMTRLGNSVYGEISNDGKDSLALTGDVKQLVGEIKGLEGELAQLREELSKARRQNGSSSVKE